MINNILILDTETTGLDPKKGAKMIEICGILYNVQHKAVLQVYSTLLPCETNAAEHINLISPVITNLPYSILHTLQIFNSMIEHADALVAHNAQFDKQFVNEFLPLAVDKKWLCTKNDFKWPVPLRRYRLQDVCEAMEVPYVDAHRALQDCMFMVQCFNKVTDLFDRFNKVAS